MTSSLIEMRERLRRAPWAADLAIQQLDRVEMETEISRYATGSIVCQRGLRSQHWIGVLDGMAKADTVSASGRATTCVGVTTGGWLGEGSLLKQELRPYDVVTLRESWIALMPLSTFSWLYETSLSFNHFLCRQLNARLGQFVSVVNSSRMESTTAQVATSLAELFNPMLCPASSKEIQLSQEEIARLCGLSRQIVNRALHELQVAGLVRMQYGAIQVLDVGALSAYGRGDLNRP